MIQITRIYDKSGSHDDSLCFTILVDRLWPRGLRKDKVRVDLWLKDIAPSDQLRRWFDHDPTKWSVFRKKYFAELESKSELVQIILNKSEKDSVCLLYGAKDEIHNNAVALKEFLDYRLGSFTTH
jgi:uncharacterized protein YeaO (DUF488 family)